jgi:UDP-3-O-[3-hydroxymyristoyl] N-acetylglucosamine deacetylase
MQHTLKTSVYTSGIGLHSGKAVNLAMHPAKAGTGILFVRMDVKDKNNLIPALWNHVVDTQLCTVIGNVDNVRVGTIEHLMAALRGCGIDNVVIEVDAAEVPVMDGSALPFVTLIEQAGTLAQIAPRQAIRVLKEIIVEQDGKRAMLSPSDDSVFAGDIAFDHADIGAQQFETKLLNGNFKHDVADSRTFGFLHEVEFLRKNGLGLGGSLDNAIVLNDDGVMNPDGLRHKDEFIRHKILDAIGDLYLAGGPILGAYKASKPGHAMNNALLRKLFSQPGAWEMVDLHEDESSAEECATETLYA